MPFGPQGLQHIDAVLARQPDIEQDEGGLQASGHLQSLTPIHGVCRLKTVLLQIKLQNLGDLLLIFDDEYAIFRHPASAVPVIGALTRF